MDELGGVSGGGGVDAVAALVRALLGSASTERSAVGGEQLPQFLTAVEAAELLRVSTDLIYDMIRGGEFPAIRMRSRYVVPAGAVQRLAAEALASGSVVDIAEWTRRWREGQSQGSAAWVG